MLCNYCGGQVVKRGGRRTRDEIVQRYRCKDCGRWQTGESTNKRKDIEDLNNVVTFDDFLDVALTHQKLNDKLECSSIEATAKLKHSDIIAVLGCFHFGASGVNYDFLRDFTKELMNKKIPFIMAGDDVDMFFKNFFSASPIHSQLLSPDQQLIMLEKWLEKVGHLLLCSCEGNHEERIKKLTGLKIFDRLKSKFAPFSIS